MRSSTLAFFLLTSAALNAQWSTDPANPLVICNAANGQANVRAVSDGVDGWFVFWTDARVDPGRNELYGQHVDEEGNALWAANGLLIASHPDSTVTHIAPVTMWDGTLLLGYIYGNGSSARIEVLHLDANGAALWPAPVELARSGPGTLGNIFGFAQLQGLMIGNDAYFAWSFVPQGSNDLYAYEHIDLDGNVQFGTPGHAVPNSGWGPFTFHDGLAGGLIFDWRQGNGAGAPLQAMRMDSTGTPSWTQNLSVSTGTSGLNYAYGTTTDGFGSTISSWASNSDLPMAKYDTSGTFLWTPAPFFACSESHGQDNPVLVWNDGSLFVGWGDNRPPASNQDMYVQKFDANGVAQWTADGVAAIQAQTYIPTPGLVPSDNGTVIATFDPGNPGFCAMRLLADGTHAWPELVAFCTGAFNPFYGDQVKLPDGAGGVVAFWSDQDEVYGARIYKIGTLGNHIGFDESTATDGTLQLSPSPTAGAFNATYSGRSPILSIRAIDAEGRSVLLPSTRNNDRLQLDGSALANGVYTLELVTDAGVRTGRFIIAR